MPLPDAASAPRTRRRDKLSPDPAVRGEILAAASTTLRELGVRGFNVAAVLERANLSTRAFYRHFDSRDEAVAAWIDARLDLAFDDNIRSDLRRLSLEAQSQTFASPSLIQPAYAEMLK